MSQRSSAASVSASSFNNSSISTAADVVESWHAPTTRGWLDAAGRTTVLPSTARGFALFILVLSMVAVATFLQVLLSAQILATELRIAEMQAQLDSVEQRNAELGWQAAMVSQLDSVAGRARAAGFVAVEEPTYVERTVALDALPDAGPQPFFAELPQAVAISPEAPDVAVQWFAGVRGSLRQSIGGLRSQAEESLGSLRSQLP